MIRRLTLQTTTFVALALTVAFAQEARGQEGERPRVALVLGGGGARGFAHVGVLRALHEAHIPVDVVVGTSMGAIVGGLYASGIPLDDIEALLETRDWPLLFDDDPARASIRLRRKREERELLIPFDVGVSTSGIRLPTGLLGGDKLLTLLQIYTLHALGNPSFDARPLPFRAVATDARTGERVVLDRGSLAMAARASASVPGVFSPIEIDGRELIDGGLVDNLPVELGRSLGASIVIAVDVGSTLDDEPETALDLAQRATTIMIRESAADQLAALTPTDWLIVPDLEGVNSAGFSASSYETAVAAGVAAVRADSSHRLALSVSAVEFDAWDARRTADWDPNSEIVIGQIRADVSRTSLAPEVVTGVFPFRSGDRIGREELADGVASVLGYGGFSAAGLALEERDGAIDIRLRPVDKPWGPGILRTGLVLEDRQRGRALWSLGALLTQGRLNSFGGIFKAEVRVGSQQALRAEWYQPLDASERFFANLRGELSRDNELVPRGEGLSESVDLSEIGATVTSGPRLGTWGELAVGLRVARVDADRSTGSDIALPAASNVTSWLGRFEVDVLDRAAFPTRGVLLRSELELARSFLGGNETFDRLAADVVAAFSRGSHSLIIGVGLGTGLGDTLRLGRDFQLGGLFRISAAEAGSLRGSYSGLGRLIYYLRPGSPAARREGTALRFGGSLETGQTWASSEDVDPGDLIVAGTLFAALDTPLGPLHAGWAWAQERSPTWFFRIGPVF